MHQKLDMADMREAAGKFIGTHDFKSFCNIHTQVEDTVRTIYSCELRQNDNHEIVLRMEGNGFLYNMVRIIAGTIAEVGMGRYRPVDITKMLEQKDREYAGKTAPAKGLRLVKIEYVDEDFE